MDFSHPLIAKADLINERHIVVFDHVHSLPFRGEPWVSPEFVIVLCNKGWLKARYDMRPVTFHENDVTIVYPEHVLVAREWSEDYDVTLVVASEKWARQQHISLPMRNAIEYILRPDFRLTDSQMEVAQQMVLVLNMLGQLEAGSMRDEMLRHQMDNFIRLLDFFRASETNAKVEKLSTPKRVAYRFYQDLVAHYKESREVSFYANLQCLTAKYFGTMIYETTHIHATEWIQRYVVTKAKYLLQHRPDLTVSQVAQQVGFGEQSDFGRYFKRQTGVSPAQFRSYASREDE